jgi:hypothetical protein
MAGETEVLGENLPQRHFVHHKIPHDQSRARTPDRSGGKPATNRLSYGAALVTSIVICYINLGAINWNPYLFTLNRHDTLKEESARSFVIYYITCVHAKCECQRSTIRSNGNPKLPNFGVRSHRYTILLYLHQIIALDIRLRYIEDA